MAVTVDQVRHIASLARLRFTEEEEVRLAKEMSEVLDYVAKLEELDTADVPTMSHVLDMRNVFREDKEVARITHEEALQGAPNADAAYFRVPKVIE